MTNVVISNPFSARRRAAGRHQLGRVCALMAIVASAVALVDVQPATGATTATVTITGGALSITVPTDAGSLGSVANTVGGSTISGQLGVVQVDDARSAAAGTGWVATGISTAFTPPAGPTIAASNVGYSVGPIT
ncbi:MAG: hypothetical protein ACI81L_002134, partial [Verrucomicrobiales bacterium]